MVTSLRDSLGFCDVRDNDSVHDDKILSNEEEKIQKDKSARTLSVLITFISENVYERKIIYI